MQDLNTVIQQTSDITAELTNASKQIGSFLADLHTEQDADKRLDLAKSTWEWCGYLTTLTENSASLTGADAKIAAEALEQRNAALAELEDLVEAIENVDYSNPHVSALSEYIEEGISENLQWELAERDGDNFDQGRESGYDDGWNAAIDDLINDIERTCHIAYGDAELLIDVLRGNEKPSVEDINRLAAQFMMIFEDMKGEAE